MSLLDKTREDTHENLTMEASQGNPKENRPENPMENRILECVETRVRLSSLLARTMFLKGTHICASTDFLSSITITTLHPTISLETMLTRLLKR